MDQLGGLHTLILVRLDCLMIVSDGHLDCQPCGHRTTRIDID